MTVVALLACLTSVACSTLFDLSKLGPDPGAAPDSPPSAPIVSDAGSRDADSDAAELEEDSSAPCPAGSGAPMKRIGVYCIDTTEVTSGRYQAFLATTDAGATTAAAPAACAADLDRVPTENWPPRPEWKQLAVTDVSWCDAHAYCAHTGRRLCGRRGGSSLVPGDSTNAATSEWYRACSKAGTKKLPYGDEPIVGECSTTNELRVVGEKCEGGYVGIFDMVGNAEEWVEACAGMAGVDMCMAQGGSALDRRADCTTAKAYGRHVKRPLVGFRCCAD